MGQPIGVQYPPGDDCNKCWGLGKTFGDNTTPYSVYISWEGLVGGLAGGNKTFIGIQDPIIPCRWLIDDGVYVGHWTFSAAITTSYIELKTGPPPFLGISGLLCDTTLFGAGATSTIR